LGYNKGQGPNEGSGTEERGKEVSAANGGSEMKRVLNLAFLIFCFIGAWQVSNARICIAGPVLFFSDLNWGPKTGWEGSATKGAAVTVWGKGIGTARGNSYITVNGAPLPNDSDYAEWGAVGPARGLERITFWLNSNCQDGTGTITVTVGGVVSNALDFQVMTGKIYFISENNGDNSFNGLYSAPRGGINGPFRDILKFNPGLNPSGTGESYLCYVRGGTYTALDVDNAFVALRGPYGSANRRYGLIAYPGETPELNAGTATRGVIWNANYDPYGRNNYFTCSKLKVFATSNSGWGAFGLWGDHNRIVGNHMKDLLADAWTGVVMVDNSQYSEIYGNLFDHLGYDSYKHNIYIKTHQSYAGSAEFTYVGWNEFNDAYAGDTHGGVIFISKESTVTAKYTRYIYIHDNYFHDGNMEFIYTGDNTDISDIYIYNNIFRHGTCTNTGVFLAWHTRSVYLYNNLFYQIGNPGVPMVSVTGNTSAVFRNNTFYSRPGQAFLVLEAYQGASINSDHDLFFDPGASASPPSGTGITLTNPLRRDPRFVNASAYDFHLATNSPAINAGTSEGLNLSSYVRTDYDGNSRPLAGLYDIGPFEGEGSGGGGDLMPPAAPRGLIILR
jgi:hypothetical protein